MKDMKSMKGKPKEFSELSYRIIGCAMEVHRALGPGLLESTYQRCLVHEFEINTISFRAEYPLPVAYKGIDLDCGYRLDFLVEDAIILELKSVEKLLPIHEAQLLTYMKLLNVKEGFLINFNVKRLKDGIKRYVQ
jgi:GxxExxY protein